MKYLLFLLFPLSSFAQITDANLNLEADTIRTETHAGRNTAQRIGRMFKNIIANKPNSFGPPTFTAGTNISITGTWPSLTISQSGGGGITNSASNLEFMMSDGTNGIHSNIFNTSSGAANIIMGGGSTTGTTRILSTGGSSSDIDLNLSPKGNGRIQFGSSINIQLGGTLGVNTMIGGLNSTFILKTWDGNGSGTSTSSSNDFTISTGDGGTGGTTSSGNLNLNTGSPNSGTKGKIILNGIAIGGNYSYTTITTIGNWSNVSSSAGYYTDALKVTHLRGAISIAYNNFPGVGNATSTSAVPNASNGGKFCVPVYRNNGIYFIGMASISITNVGQIQIDGFVSTASTSSTGTAGVNVSLSGTDNVYVYLDSIFYL